MNASTNPSGSVAPVAAIFYAFGAFFLFSCTDAGAKYLIQSGLHPVFASWVRFFVQALLIPILFRAWLRPERFRPRSLMVQVLRGVMLFTSGVLSFSALRTLQLVEFISIIFMAPLVITAMGRLILGEAVEWQRWGAVIIGLCGILVVTRPGFGVFELGHLQALGAMLSYCVFAVLTRQMSATESPESLLLFPALVAVAFLAPAAPFMGPLPADGWEWALLISLGFSGAFGHMLLIRAYKAAAASVIAPYAYLQLVWTVAFGYFVFGDLPDFWTAVGTAIIVASGLFLMHRDRLARLAARVA